MHIYTHSSWQPCGLVAAVSLSPLPAGQGAVSEGTSAPLGEKLWLVC